ncbi:hypothetical protein BsBEST3125_02980 [Bacillus subtilis]|nr:hypothetical protein BsBEST3106_02980 [Bacillus subtilis]BDB91551.1 hypothetical protein BSG8_03030 [Bacillus subtilis subsp. natto]BCV86203.1 hypothetical protein BsBEST3109_02990 [Bacillus subtilis]BCV90435.1 hypothetical protein BsBEST3125_02980 [Bacillus subtilis]BCV94670.1 hypothetical protein BsBEST3136_03090 [Bacillus subtilis]
MTLLFLIDHGNDGDDHEKTYADEKTGRLDLSNNVPDTAAAIRTINLRFSHALGISQLFAGEHDKQPSV